MAEVGLYPSFVGVAFMAQNLKKNFLRKNIKKLDVTRMIMLDSRPRRRHKLPKIASRRPVGGGVRDAVAKRTIGPESPVGPTTSPRAPQAAACESADSIETHEYPTPPESLSPRSPEQP